MGDSQLDVVTGGAGFIGSHLVDALAASGLRVRVLDNLSTGRLQNLAQHAGGDRIEVVEGSVTDRALVRDAVAGAGRVFHLAALADIVPSVREPEAYYDTNVNGTFSVVEAARAANIRRLVYVASASCYGIPDVYPTPETAPIRPQYPYALTKYLGEQLVMHWAEVYGLPALSLRLFNVYGPRARTSGAYGAVFGVFLAQLLAGAPLTVVGDGEQTRDFTFVSDVVDALITAAESGRVGEIYNVGSNQDVSVNTLVKLVGATDVVHVPKRPGEPDRTLADTRKIGDHLGWQPKVSFEEGVKVVLENIDDWRDAPVWTVDDIEKATTDWFKYLGGNRAQTEPKREALAAE